MKNKFLPLLAALITIALNSFSQNGPNFPRMNSIQTRGAIFVKELDGKAPKYFTEEDVKLGHDSFLENNMYFWMRDNQNKVNIYLPFFNPLNSKVSSYSKSVTNPSIAVLDSLFNSLGSTAAIVFPASGFTYLRETSTNASGVAINTKKVVDNLGVEILIPNNVESKIKTITLKDWAYKLLEQPSYSQALDDSLTKMISRVENLLFFKVVIDKKSANFDDHVKDVSKPLYDAVTLEDYKAAIVALKAKKTLLDNAVSNANASFENLLKTIRDPGFAVSPGFKMYSSNTADEFEARIKPMIQAKQKILKDLEEFINKNDEIQKQYSKCESKEINGHKYYLFNEFQFINKEKDLEIILSHRKISEGVLSKDSTAVKFTIVNGRPLFVPFLSPGVAWFVSDVTYTSFNLDNDTITQSVSTKTILPTAYVNFYSKLGKNWYGILPQIGLSSGKELPMILIGGGLAYGNRFILTAGFPVYWVQKLKSKSPGEYATEKEFKDALGFEFSRKYPLYISLSVRLGKNK